MAKKRRRNKTRSVPRSVTGAKRKSKSKSKKARASSMTPAQKKKVIAARVRMHQASALLKDFHGGKLPIKSGCGRPRGSGAEG